jgi:hypothetical protein
MPTSRFSPCHGIEIYQQWTDASRNFLQGFFPGPENSACFPAFKDLQKGIE